MDSPITKAGFVSLVGKPNVGKSTLLNALLGMKLSIVSHKAQTTRKRVLGILTDSEYQIVFTDTPGIIKPSFELHMTMMRYVKESVSEADIVVVLIDAEKFKDPKSYLTKELIDILKSIKVPMIALINKVDLFFKKKELLPIFSQLSELGLFKEILPISALKNDNIEKFIDILKKYLPESPFFYDPELLSTQPEKFFVSELIREIVLEEFHEEIPYAVEVNIIEFKERESGKWFIHAEIIVERKSQKGIIIGAKGDKIKKIGERSRKLIEEHLDEEVYLELFVKVRENWRKNKNMLRSFGY